MEKPIEIGAYYPTHFETNIYFSKAQLKKSLTDSRLRTIITLTMFHEWVHFLQFIFTSFGRSVTWMLRYEAHEAFAIVKHLLENNQTVSIPIVLNQDKINNDEISRRSTYLGLTVWLRNLLHGEQYFPPDFPASYYNSKIPKARANPIYTFSNGEQYVVSSLQIVEGHARSWQVDFALYLGAAETEGYSKDELIKLLGDTSIKDPYDLALMIMAETFDTSLYKVLEITQMVCNIALNPMLDNNTNQDWEDVHPGWRFIRVVEYFKKNNWSVKDIKNIENVGASILNEFGWQRPDKTLDNWLGKEDFFQPYDESIKKIVQDSPFLLSNLIKNIQTIQSTFPFEMGSVGMSNFEGDELSAQVYFRQYFSFIQRISALLLGGKALSKKEYRELSKLPIYTEMKKSGEFDLDKLIESLEI